MHRNLSLLAAIAAPVLMAATCDMWITPQNVVQAGSVCKLFVNAGLISSLDAVAYCLDYEFVKSPVDGKWYRCEDVDSQLRVMSRHDACMKNPSFAVGTGFAAILDGFVAPANSTPPPPDPVTIDTPPTPPPPPNLDNR